MATPPARGSSAGATTGARGGRKTVPLLQPVSARRLKAGARTAAAPTTTSAPKAAGKRGVRAPTPASAKPARVSTQPATTRTAAELAVIDRVRAICLALPDTTEVLAWGEPTWRVGGKLFAMFDTHHHGNPHLGVWIPAAPGAQAALIDADPERFWRPPYVGHKGWVGIHVDDAAPPWDMIAALIADAHQLVAPVPKVRRGRAGA